jgi:hypothetical protein
VVGVLDGQPARHQERHRLRLGELDRGHEVALADEPATTVLVDRYADALQRDDVAQRGALVAIGAGPELAGRDARGAANDLRDLEQPRRSVLLLELSHASPGTLAGAL